MRCTGLPVGEGALTDHIAYPLGWINHIEAGDVVKSGNGLLRVVRHVCHSVVTSGGTRPHIRTTVVFAIKHCSWTHRCYTIYTGNDLVQMRYRPTRAKVSLRKRIDRAIAEEFRRPGNIKRARLTCCDVESVP